MITGLQTVKVMVSKMFVGNLFNTALATSPDTVGKLFKCIEGKRGELEELSDNAREEDFCQLDHASYHAKR